MQHIPARFMASGLRAVGLLVGIWIAGPCIGQTDWWGESGYRLGVTTQIEGVISQVHLRNPHSLIFIEARDKDGQSIRRAIQWRGVSELIAAGVNSNTLKVGDYVVIEGHPARNPYDSRVLLSRMTRTADGFVWQN